MADPDQIPEHDLSELSKGIVAGIDKWHVSTGAGPINGDNLLNALINVACTVIRNCPDGEKRATMIAASVELLLRDAGTDPVAVYGVIERMKLQVSQPAGNA
jgi:hypothetical protein